MGSQFDAYLSKRKNRFNEKNLERHFKILLNMPKYYSAEMQRGISNFTALPKITGDCISKSKKSIKTVRKKDSERGLF